MSSYYFPFREGSEKSFLFDANFVNFALHGSRGFITIDLFLSTVYIVLESWSLGLSAFNVFFKNFTLLLMMLNCGW